MKLFDRTRGHLNQAVAGLATLQGLNVIAVERKTRQVGKLRRIAEHTERQIVGKLAKAVEIAGKLKIALRSSMDVDRAEQEDLGRRAGPQGFGDRLSASNGGDLILTQADVLLKENLQAMIRLSIAGPVRPCNPNQQQSRRHKPSDHRNYTPSVFRYGCQGS